MTHSDIKASYTARNISPNGDYVWLCNECSHFVSGYDAADVWGEGYAYSAATELNARVWQSMLMVRGMAEVATNETSDSNLLTACDVCGKSHNTSEWFEAYTVRYAERDEYPEAALDEARANALIYDDSTARYSITASECIPTVDTIIRNLDGAIVALIANSGIKFGYRTVFDARYGTAIVSVAKEATVEETHAKILRRFVNAGY